MKRFYVLAMAFLTIALGACSQPVDVDAVRDSIGCLTPEDLSGLPTTGRAEATNFLDALPKRNIEDRGFTITATPDMTWIIWRRDFTLSDRDFDPTYGKKLIPLIVEGQSGVWFLPAGKTIRFPEAGAFACVMRVDLNDPGDNDFEWKIRVGIASSSGS